MVLGKPITRQPILCGHAQVHVLNAVISLSGEKRNVAKSGKLSPTVSGERINKMVAAKETPPEYCTAQTKVNAKTKRRKFICQP